MYLAPIRTSDFTRNKVDSKGSRKRTLDALEKFRKAQENLEKVCAELGIPVPEMICQAAKQAEVPETLLRRVIVELGLLNIKGKRIDASTAHEVSEHLKTVYKDNLQAEWRFFEPNVNLYKNIHVQTLDIYLGPKRIITLQ